MVKKESNECIFCKFVAGSVPFCKIWEDKEYLAFLDSKPIKPGHILLIPKKHTNYLFDLNDKEYSKLMLNAKKLARVLKSSLNPKRVGVAVEGFGVPHVHIHLVPLNKGNELNPEKAKYTDPKNLRKIAKRIKIKK